MTTLSKLEFSAFLINCSIVLIITDLLGQLSFWMDTFTTTQNTYKIVQQLNTPWGAYRVLHSDCLQELLTYIFPPPKGMSYEITVCMSFALSVRDKK